MKMRAMRVIMPSRILVVKGSHMLSWQGTRVYDFLVLSGPSSRTLFLSLRTIKFVKPLKWPHNTCSG